MTKLMLALVLGVFAAAAVPVSSQGALHRAFDAEQTEAIERIARDYIINNPEILVQALRILQDRRRLADQARTQATLVAKRDQLAHDPGSPVGGNPDGNVTIVEFFDYRCLYCKAVMPRISRLLAEDDEIRLVYKEWPILGPVSEFAAKVALAAWKQDAGKYEAFHRALLGVKGKLNEGMIFEAASRLGLDVDRLKSEIASPQIEAILARNRALASSLGITGTPAFIIGDSLVPGAASLAQMRALVEQARKGG